MKPAKVDSPAGVLALDHVAFGVRSIAEVSPIICRQLGGRPYHSGPGIGFRGAQWELAGGGRVEAIEPEGPPTGFLHRFLGARGPRVHHVTFKVADIHRAAAAATAAGYTVVGLNDALASWKELFLHPKEAQGIVVQLAESHPELGDDGWSAEWPFPRAEVADLGRPRVIGLRLRCASASNARRQWSELLGASVREVGDLLVFEWPDSPLRLSVEVLIGGHEEGPVAMEVAVAPSSLPLDAGIEALGCGLVAVS